MPPIIKEGLVHVKKLATQAQRRKRSLLAACRDHQRTLANLCEDKQEAGKIAALLMHMKDAVDELCSGSSSSHLLNSAAVTDSSSQTDNNSNSLLTPSLTPKIIETSETLENTVEPLSEDVTGF